MWEYHIGPTCHLKLSLRRHQDHHRARFRQDETAERSRCRSLQRFSGTCLDMFGSNNHQHQEKNESLSAWGVFVWVKVRGLVRSHHRDHWDPNSTQPRCSQWRSRQERVPCYKNTLSWNTQHLGTRWCSCLGLVTLHFMDCIRKISSGNSATQTITSITRIQMIQLGLPQTSSNYAFFLLSL